MKKILAILVSALMLTSVVGCGVNLETGKTSVPNSQSVQQSENSTLQSVTPSQKSTTSVESASNTPGATSPRPGTSSTKPVGNSSNNSSTGGGTLVSTLPYNPPVIVPSTGDPSDPKTPEFFQLTHNNANLTGTAITTNQSAFNAEGYGSKATGGGNLKVGDQGYVQVSTAEQFLKAIARSNMDDKNDAGWSTRPMVIELTQDIDLGFNKVGKVNGDIVAANAATVHPTLKQTGVSVVYITGRQNLTIFSKNGSAIKHACFQIRGYDGAASQNIIIRNVRFFGAWEWDDSGKYDNNDWDTFTIRADKGPVKNIWIDHCTFTKPYDGTIDIKYNATDITISWCAFIPYEKTDTEFMDMMNYMEANRSAFPNYDAARKAGASFDDMVEYAGINKKVGLIGHTDNNPGDENIRVTFANNYYYNCTERMPRLRLGKAHVYNTVFDATRANALQNSIKSRGIAWPEALSFASNGSLGTNYGQLLIENSHISGINTPLRNNNKKDGAMYVGAVDALYTYYTIENINRSAKYGTGDVIYNGRYTFLGHSTKVDGNYLQPFPSAPLPFDTDAFKNQLGYEYILYNPLELYRWQTGNVGAGKMGFTESQWLKTSYTSSDNFSNAIPQNGIKGSTANLGAGRA